MRTTLFLELVLLVTTAWAGGYQGALERLWWFYAYELDELNSVHTMGLKCESWNDLDKKNQFCNKDIDGKERWKKCPGTKGGRCNFNQFLNHIGGLPKSNLQLVGGKDANGIDLPQNTKTPGITETAKNIFDAYATQNKKIKNPPYYKVTNEKCTDYNDFITKVNDLVIRTSTHKTADNAILFDRFVATTEAIKIARIGDHGPFLIQNARAHFTKLGVDIKIENVGDGINPGDPTKPWQTVDWEATISEAVRNGMKRQDVKDEIKRFEDAFYNPNRKDDEPAKHLAVMKSYNHAINQLSTCI